MSEEFKEPQEFLKDRPKIDEKKIQELRDKVGNKLNKWADKIQVSMAITPKITRNEGERWIEDGKTWEMKGGVRMSVSNLVEARMPFWCPKCTKPMNHKWDRKFWSIRGWCYDCNIEFEGQMRLDGTWDRFEKETMRANEISWLKDKIAEHMDYIRTFKEPQIFFEDGRYEVLATKDEFSELFKTIEKDIEFMLARLEVIKAEQEAEELQNDNSGNNQKSDDVVGSSIHDS
jgi:hypothetical protein